MTSFFHVTDSIITYKISRGKSVELDRSNPTLHSESWSDFDTLVNKTFQIYRVDSITWITSRCSRHMLGSSIHHIQFWRNYGQGQNAINKILWTSSYDNLS